MQVALRLCGENRYHFPRIPQNSSKLTGNILRISCYTGSIN